jgi:Meiotically Up-regulated Gene 113 (MUG113) protein
MASLYVYVIGPERGEHVKIGIAKNVHTRLISLQNGSPSRLAMHASIPVPAHLAHQIEDHAHWILYEFRNSGEWFAVSAELAKKAVSDAAATVKKYAPKTKDRTSTMLCLRCPAYLALEIDEALKGGEGRSDLIRAAVHQELIRRKKRK